MNDGVGSGGDDEINAGGAGGGDEDDKMSGGDAGGGDAGRSGNAGGYGGHRRPLPSMREKLPSGQRVHVAAPS